MGKRTYSSPRRQEQAAQTRALVVQAARRVFVRKGFASSTMNDVAAESGVAVQTIYLSFHGKAELLMAINDQLDGEAGIGEIVAALRASTEPERILANAVRATRQINERCGDVLRILFASSLEADGLGNVWREGLRRHEQGVALAVSLLEKASALRVPSAQARAILSTLTAPSTWWFLVDHHQRDWDDAEKFLLEQAREALCKPMPRSARSPAGRRRSATR